MSVPVCLSQVLRRDSLATTPEAYAAHGGESEENTEVVRRNERRQPCKDLPKCNAQAPNGFHLIACGLARTNPVAVHNLSTLLVEGVLELGAQLRCRFSDTGGADDLAVQIRKGLANDSSDNR